MPIGLARTLQLERHARPGYISLLFFLTTSFSNIDASISIRIAARNKIYKNYYQCKYLRFPMFLEPVCPNTYR